MSNHLEDIIQEYHKNSLKAERLQGTTLEKTEPSAWNEKKEKVLKSFKRVLEVFLLACLAPVG
jgi:hypothetical protein